MTPFGSDPFRLPPFRWPDRFAGPSANPQLASFHTDLINAGKPKKLALIAAMRQLPTILQSLLRGGTPWRAPQSLWPAKAGADTFLTTEQAPPCPI